MTIVPKRQWLLRCLRSRFPDCSSDIIKDEADEAIALWIASPLQVRASPNKTASWLLITARRNVIRRIKESRKFTSLPDNACAPPYVPAGTWSEDTRQEMINIDYEATNIEDIYENLSINDSKIVRLLLEGFSLKEIADQQNITEDAAKKRYQRVIVKLRKYRGITSKRKGKE